MFLKPMSLQANLLGKFMQLVDITISHHVTPTNFCPVTPQLVHEYHTLLYPVAVRMSNNFGT